MCCVKYRVFQYLTNPGGPVPLVIYLRITHERWGSVSNPSLKLQLYYPPPTDIDRPLNETVVDEIRDYRTDYNNLPSNDISFVTAVPSTSSPLRVYDHFLFAVFASSGVLFP